MSKRLALRFSDIDWPVHQTRLAPKVGGYVSPAFLEQGYFLSARIYLYRNEAVVFDDSEAVFHDFRLLAALA